MRFKFLIILAISSIYCKVYCQEEIGNPDVPLSKEVEEINFVHIVSTLEEGADVSRGKSIGKVENFPLVLSKRFQSEIVQSQTYYEKKEYRHSKEILETALINEPDNLFILNTYARACYQTDREKSYRVYKKLINELDSTMKNSKTHMVVDVWFREAYWKFGTLLMDMKKWDEAYYEISRFILSMQDMKGQFVYEQALEYLTECAYMTGNRKQSNYLAKRLLKYNPNNEYGKKILIKTQN